MVSVLGKRELEAWLDERRRGCEEEQSVWKERRRKEVEPKRVE